MKVQDTELAWLAGIIDGEGSMGFYRKGPGKGGQIKLSVKVTCPRMITKISKIFADLGVTFSYDAETHSEESGWKPTLRIKVSGSSGVVAVLNAIASFLTTKADEASVILGYFIWRRCLPTHTGNKSHGMAISMMQEKLIEDLNALKKRRMNPDDFDLTPSRPLALVKR